MTVQSNFCRSGVWTLKKEGQRVERRFGLGDKTQIDRLKDKDKDNPTSEEGRKSDGTEGDTIINRIEGT